MPQTYFPDTYLRLDASSYHHKSFFIEEEKLAHSLGMKYHAVHFSKDGVASLPSLTGKICLVTNTHTPVEKLPESLLKQTVILLHPNSGYDNFPLEWVEKQSFPIILGNSIRAQAVTQYILNELFSYFNHVETHRNWDKNRNWDRPLLDQQNILIVGHGVIGKKLEASLSPLTSLIDIYDPFNGHNLDLQSSWAKYNTILFACSLNESSQHLLNEKSFSSLRSDVLIINAARGSLIEEKALCSFLEKHPHAFAILDVFEKEPFQNQFEKIQNIKTTSHIAGVSRDLDERIVNFCREELLKLRDKEEFAQDFILGNRIRNYNQKRILI